VQPAKDPAAARIGSQDPKERRKRGARGYSALSPSDAGMFVALPEHCTPTVIKRKNGSRAGKSERGTCRCSHSFRSLYDRSTYPPRQGPRLKKEAKEGERTKRSRAIRSRGTVARGWGDDGEKFFITTDRPPEKRDVRRRRSSKVKRIDRKRGGFDGRRRKGSLAEQRVRCGRLKEPSLQRGERFREGKKTGRPKRI